MDHRIMSGSKYKTNEIKPICIAHPTIEIHDCMLSVVLANYLSCNLLIFFLN